MRGMLQLQSPRDLGEVVGDTLRVFFGNFVVFFTMTLLVVAPLTVLVEGIWGQALSDGPDADGPLAAFAVGSLLQFVVVPPLVTALHVVVVMRLADGGRPTVATAIRGAAPTFLPAIAVVALYGFCVSGGLLLLIGPGIFLSVSWYFGAQVAVVEGRRNVDALSRSADLVTGRWWATFGRLLVVSVVAGLITVPLAAGAALVHDGVAFVALTTVERTITLSLSAIAGTLLFFDLRARKARPQPAAFAPPASPTPAT